MTPIFKRTFYTYHPNFRLQTVILILTSQVGTVRGLLLNSRRQQCGGLTTCSVPSPRLTTECTNALLKVNTGQVFNPDAETIYGVSRDFGVIVFGKSIEYS